MTTNYQTFQTSQLKKRRPNLLFSAQLRNVFTFIRHYAQAKTKYDIHSPFLSEFCTEVLEDSRQYYAFTTARQLRHHWIKADLPVAYARIGALSRATGTTNLTTAKLVRHGSIRPHFGKLLFHLCQWIKPRRIVEMGTQLGIGTVYLRASAPAAELTTIEGNPEMARLARRTFELSHARNIEQLFGTFDEALPGLIEQTDCIDLLYLDGDHRGDATQRYVRQWLSKARPGTCFVLDDIHWSADMTAAWEAIRQWPEFDVSIDLYQVGLLFVRPEIQKPIHVSLVPWHWKPWRMGFW